MSDKNVIHLLSYEIDYTHVVRVAVMANDPEGAEEAVREALGDTGIDHGSSNPVMLGEEWTQSEGQVFINHLGTAESMPAQESSVLMLKEHDDLLQAAELLDDALDSDGTVNMEKLLHAHGLALEVLRTRTQGTSSQKPGVNIARTPANDFRVDNLARNESLHVQVENFDLSIKRTDEGLVVDVFPHGQPHCEPIATTYAFDGETLPEEVNG